jgi:predicted metalloprotease with PDZ domain
MIRNIFLFVLSVAFSLTVANQASAQIILPTLPLLPKAQAERFKEIERLQAEQFKELERLLEQAGQRPAGSRLGSGMQWGGVRLEKPSAEMQIGLGLGENEGLVVSAVGPNSVGEKAGLKPKDVLVKVGDKSVPSDAAGFTKLVKDQQPNEAVDLVVVRDGKEETIKGAN